MEVIESKDLIRKRLIVFALVAYGISFLMMIPMYIGKQNGMDLTQIVDAQMCSPAAGVALGYLMFYKGEKRVPKMFMIVLVINYVIQLVLGLLSIFANPFTADDVINLAQAAGPASDDVTALAGSQSVLKLQQIYLLLGELALMGCSILLWIGYFTAGRERRKFAGLSRNNEGKGALLILLFVGLYCLRIFVPMIAEGLLTNTLREYGEMYAGILKNPLFYLSIISLPINYPLLIIAFLGEEYGWRHFLQPIMQKKFGMKLGVILLGVVWGLWHIPVDTMYYTQDSVPQMIIGQIITCVAIGIFFGYAYLKTNNIWVPVCMHFLNNNLIPILTGEFTAEVLEDQHVPWEYLIEILIIDFLVFCLFIFAKEYKEKKKTKEALDA
jgi:membrane protease YdiL (CAAX protease family)